MSGFATAWEKSRELAATALGAAAEKLGGDKVGNANSFGHEFEHSVYDSTLEDIVTRYRKDRKDLLLYLLSSKSVAAKVVLPPGATSLREVDLNHVSVPYIISCAVAGKELDLGIALARGVNMDEDDSGVQFDAAIDEMEAGRMSDASTPTDHNAFGSRSPASDMDQLGGIPNGVASPHRDTYADGRSNRESRAHRGAGYEEDRRRGSGYGEVNGMESRGERGEKGEKGEERRGGRGPEKDRYDRSSATPGYERGSDKGSSAGRATGGDLGEGVGQGQGRKSKRGSSTRSSGVDKGAREIFEEYLSIAVGPMQSVPEAFCLSVGKETEGSFKPPTDLTDHDLHMLAYDFVLATAFASGQLKPIQGQPGAPKEKEKKGNKLMAKFLKSKSKVSKAEASEAAGADLAERVGTLLELLRQACNVADQEDEHARAAVAAVFPAPGAVGKRPMTGGRRPAEGGVQGRGPGKVTILLPLDMMAGMKSIKFTTKGELRRFALPKVNAMRDLLLGSQSQSGDISSSGPIREHLDRIEDAVNKGDPGTACDTAFSLAQFLRNGGWETELQSGRKGNAAFGGAVVHQGLACTLEIAREWMSAEEQEEGEEEQLKELLDMIGAPRTALGVSDSLYEALMGCAILQLLPGTPDEWVAATGKTEERSKEKLIEDLYSCLKRLSQAIPNSSRQSTLSLVDRLVDAMRRRLDSLTSDIFRVWPQGPASSSCRRGICCTLLAAVITHTIHCKTGRVAPGTQLIPPEAIADPTFPPAAHLRMQILLHSVFNGHERAQSAEGDDAADKNKRTAAVVGWGKGAADQIISPGSNSMNFPCTKEQLVAASMLHDILAVQLRDYLAQLSELSNESRQVLQNAGMLTAAVYNLRATEGKKAGLGLPKFRPLNIEETLARVFPQWVSEQQEKLLIWVSREFDAETWQPLAPNKCYASSAVEIFRYIDATVEHLFGMDLPVSIDHFKQLTTALDGILLSYVSKMLRDVGSMDDLAVPAPPLTRYKKEDVEQMQKKGAVRQSWGIKGKGKVGKGGLPLGALPAKGEGLSAERYQKMNHLTTTTLSVRINTCQFIFETLKDTASGVHQRWNEIALDEKDKYPATSGRVSAASLIFPQSVNTLQVAQTEIISFLAAKAVWWDLRDVLLEDLYRFSVSSARLEIVMVLLNTVLEDLVDVIEENLRNTVIEAIMLALLEALMRVLLDGGPLRVFTQSDAEMLEEDLHQLMEFFIVDGNGLPEDSVHQAMAPVQTILNYYSLDTSLVIKDYEEAYKRHRPTEGKDVTGLGVHPGETDVLLRVLCHRADRDASKFLKTVYNLPKH